MKIAFVGKGGSGKTTLASLFARDSAAQKHRVLAIDADINQHLALALGIEDVPSPLGEHLTFLKPHFAGSNTRITDPDEMIKTTPPGSGSRLIEPLENEIVRKFARTKEGVTLLATGGFTDEDLGVKCFHSKTGAVELILNHMIDKKDDLVIVDMTAGADAFASGLFTRFDMTFVVVEPTRKSLSVFDQYVSYATPFGVPLAAVGNKVMSPEDAQFIEHATGSYHIGNFPHSSFVREEERLGLLGIDGLSEHERALIQKLRDHALLIRRDKEKYLRDAQHFHRKNAHSWGNVAAGKDLSLQIDPDFRYPDEP